MARVYCDNNICKYYNKGLCRRPHIILSNTGQPKVYWLDCNSYEKEE
jgi:hypothetical protein